MGILWRRVGGGVVRHHPLRRIRVIGASRPWPPHIQGAKLADGPARQSQSKHHDRQLSQERRHQGVLDSVAREEEEEAGAEGGTPRARADCWVVIIRRCRRRPARAGPRRGSIRKRTGSWSARPAPATAAPGASSQTPRSGQDRHVASARRATRTAWISPPAVTTRVRNVRRSATGRTARRRRRPPPSARGQAPPGPGPSPAPSCNATAIHEHETAEAAPNAARSSTSPRRERRQREQARRDQRRTAAAVPGVRRSRTRPPRAGTGRATAMSTAASPPPCPRSAGPAARASAMASSTVPGPSTGSGVLRARLGDGTCGQDQAEDHHGHVHEEHRAPAGARDVGGDAVRAEDQPGHHEARPSRRTGSSPWRGAARRVADWDGRRAPAQHRRGRRALRPDAPPRASRRWVRRARTPARSGRRPPCRRGRAAPAEEVAEAGRRGRGGRRTRLRTRR